MPEASLNGVNNYYRQDGTGSRTFILFNGAGHFAIREYPERVLTEIADFIKEREL
ncbi:MAG TPA: alpha/beta hydrolase [Dehalococcoidia bacterium]|nr:alpha/beta hydrolase [Dehalococcoidia bacterium]